MIVVFEKGTNKFFGMAPQVFDNGIMREYRLEELYPNIDHSKYGCFFVEDSPRYVNDPSHWQFKLDKKGVPIGIEFKPMLSIALSTTARDADGDGLPEILVASNTDLGHRKGEDAEIRVQIMDGQKVSNTVTTVKLSTTGGTLKSRILKTDKKGFASTTLRSGTETITITVTASAEGMREDTLTFEVMPFDDFTKMQDSLPK
jgi:hypothetical protein